MNREPVFPTSMHQHVAELVHDFFHGFPVVDTVLVVNSCARGNAVPESDLDFAILMKPGITEPAKLEIERSWQTFLATHSLFSSYRQSNQFAHLHLDIIDGNYTPVTRETGEPVDFFEVEIGNQVCYSAPMGNAGSYFNGLRKIWLPYYDEALRLQRLAMSKSACEYDLDHIPFLIKRGLHFHAFDILYKAFQEYLQTLFISKKIYPIAYNKWIKEQIVKWLNMPELYPKLSPILSVSNLESGELVAKATMLRQLLHESITD